ncbi:hypothetical protein BDZ45DRAFT_742500 [Acephala macrosclerotiorum]|nr:hypothetical protein BDZ45DRAFT_742500 [Acephala macrosclerotiorum]
MRSIGQFRTRSVRPDASYNAIVAQERRVVAFKVFEGIEGENCEVLASTECFYGISPIQNGETIAFGEILEVSVDDFNITKPVMGCGHDPLVENLRRAMAKRTLAIASLLVEAISIEEICVFVSLFVFYASFLKIHQRLFADGIEVAPSLSQWFGKAWKLEQVLASQALAHIAAWVLPRRSRWHSHNF